MILHDASYEKTGKSFCDAVTKQKQKKPLHRCCWSTTTGQLLTSSSSTSTGVLIRPWWTKLRWVKVSLFTWSDCRQADWARPPSQGSLSCHAPKDQAYSQILEHVYSQLGSMNWADHRCSLQTPFFFFCRACRIGVKYNVNPALQTYRCLDCSYVRVIFTCYTALSDKYITVAVILAAPEGCFH